MNLREELQRIYRAHGQLTPRIVLDEASEPGNPLHSRFEWDDAVASHKYRLSQAHELIRSVRVVYRDAAGKPQDVRAFHAVRRPEGHVYEPVEDIVQDPITTRILLQDMEREWRQLKRRYEHFREFWELVRDDADVA